MAAVFIIFFFFSQSVFHFSVWILEPFLQQRTGVGATSFAVETFGFCHFLQ